MSVYQGADSVGVYEDLDTRNPGASELGDGLIDRVKSVAHAITNRVHEVLTHYDPFAMSDNTGDERPLKVLVVDDNPDAADALAAVVEMLGCEVRACYDGATALEYVRADPPDACLFDLMMPGLDGLALAAMVKAQVGQHPMLLVATTALGGLEERTATALAGFHFHLIKPIDTPTLRAAIDRFREVTRRPAMPRVGE
jgi:CheY-like chemotaxis protein